MEEPRDVQTMGVEECEREINDTLEDFDHSYWGEKGPAQKRAVDRMRQLHEKVFPAKGQEPHDGLADRLEREGVTLEDIEKAGEKKTGNGEELELTPEEREVLNGLKKEWGEEYEGNIGIAQETFETVATRYGDDEFRALMDKEGLGNNPTIIKLFHKLGVEQEAFDKEAREAVCPHCGEKIIDKED